MFHRFVAMGALAFVLAAAAPVARACDDNSDQLVSKLTKLNLSTDQLKAVFAYQNEHKAFITKAHREGLGCLAHERHIADFEKQAIGVLDGAQFKKYAGRERTEVESLRYENYLLSTEITRLKAEIAKMKSETGVKKADAPKAEKESCEGKKSDCCEGKKEAGV